MAKEIWESVFTVLGSGAVVALINWAQVGRSKKRDRKIDFLDKQIRDLYGPLYYFVSSSEKLLELNKRLHTAYEKEYVDTRYSLDGEVQKKINIEASATLEIGNNYIKGVEKNSKKIKEILDNCYSLIDPNDIEIFSLFHEHYTRFNVEIAGNRISTMPLKIYEDMGKISFLRPEFIDRIKKQFLDKKGKLEKFVK